VVSCQLQTTLDDAIQYFRRAWRKQNSPQPTPATYTYRRSTAFDTEPNIDGKPESRSQETPLYCSLYDTRQRSHRSRPRQAVKRRVGILSRYRGINCVNTCLSRSESLGEALYTSAELGVAPSNLRKSALSLGIRQESGGDENDENVA
jgi:hypothetical protein